MYRVKQMNRYIQMNSLKTVKDEARARCLWQVPKKCT